MPKIQVVSGVSGHPRSSTTQPFDRAYMTSYSTLVETMRILYRFRVIARFPSKVSSFNPPHLIQFEFHHGLWHQKTRVMRVMELSCSIICVILSLAVLIQYRSVTDRHTHRHTDTRRDGIQATALSIALRGKNYWNHHIPLHQNCTMMLYTKVQALSVRFVTVFLANVLVQYVDN